MAKIAGGADLMGHAFKNEKALEKQAAITRPQAWMAMRGTSREVGILDNALHNAEDRLKDLRKQLEHAEGADKAKVQDAIHGYERHADGLRTRRSAVVSRGEAKLQELAGRKKGPLEWAAQKLGIGGNREHLVEHGSALTAMKHPVVDVPKPSAAARVEKSLGKLGKNGKSLLLASGALAAGFGGGALIARSRAKRRAAEAEAVQTGGSTL